MSTDNRTTNLNLPLPDLSNLQQEDVPRIAAAFTLLDAAYKALSDLAAGKAAATHTHTIEQISGLAAALGGKAASDHLHALGSLSDVSVEGAANGQVLKRVGTAWQAAKVLLADIEGWEHTVNSLIAGQITGLKDDAPATLDTLNELAAALGDDPNFAATISAALGNRVRVDAAQTLTAGQKAQARENIGAAAPLGFTPVRQNGANNIAFSWNESNGSVSVSVDVTYVGEMAAQGWVETRYYKKSGGDITGNVRIVNAGPSCALHRAGVREWMVHVGAEGACYLFDNTLGQPGLYVDTSGQVWSRAYGAFHTYFASKGDVSWTNGQVSTLNTLVNDRVHRTGMGGYGEQRGAAGGTHYAAPAGASVVAVIRASASDNTVVGVAYRSHYQHVPGLGGWVATYEV